MNGVTELFVLYLDDKLNIYNRVISMTCKKFSAESKRTLKKEIYNEFDFMYPLNKYRTIVHNFNNGTKINIMIIDKKLTTYELNEAVLDCFKEDILASRTISYNIQCVVPKDQIRLIKSLSALEVLTSFKTPEYGKRRKRAIKRVKRNSGYYTHVPPNDISRYSNISKVLAKNNNMARELCYLPPNHLDSQKYVDRILSTMVKHKNVKTEFLDISALKKKNANLFLAVAQADLEQGCGIIKLTYVPKTKNKKRKKIALIGKGVVYDSGGLDLKTDGSLEGMHRDMTGSAIALASFLSFIELKADIELTCFLPIVENKISRDAYRTGDIIETMDGTSVEIVNTDAEGRLVMADCILLAKKSRPNLIIDYATLTGTAIDSVGGKMAAAFTNDKKLRPIIENAGESSGERVWTFPILSDIYRDICDSKQADIVQSLTDEDCDHIVGAAFLKYFADKTPFIHIDLSCEYVDNGLGLIDTDVTGFGVFFTYDFIRDFIKT